MFIIKPCTLKWIFLFIKLIIPNYSYRQHIFDDVDVTKAAYEDKSAVIVNSDFLSGLTINKAIQKAIEFIDEKGVGRSKTNYRLRDAIFSRQRYWGEPFPIFYKDGLPRLVEDDNLPITLLSAQKS